MLKKYTCIICPNGCEIEAEVLDGEIKSVSGFTCKRGEEYVRQESSRQSVLLQALWQ